MKRYLWTLLLLGSCGAMWGQVGEISVSAGANRMQNNTLGSTSDSTGGAVDLTAESNFSLVFRLTINNSGFFGHEFGYGYNHGSLRYQTSPAQDVGMSMHQGFYNFLLYATKEGSKVRPFLAGGGHFSTFYPPGTGVFNGNGTTKFGFNYGGGVKLRVTSTWGVRFDVRQYQTGKPFDLPNQKGLLRQLQATAGVSFNF